MVYRDGIELEYLMIDKVGRGRARGCAILEFCDIHS